MTSIPIPAAEGVAGTHALVIGVSHYPFADGPDSSPVGESFRLRNLSSAARSASQVASWLMTKYRNLDAPLASLRVLLSPSPGEETVVAADAATRKAVEHELAGFRADCGRNKDNIGFVYVAGHGVQLNKRGAVVLLHDFGDPEHLRVLDGAIDMAGCHAGMDEAGMARNQVWFSDACRQQPDVAREFERMEGALTLDERTGQVDASPLFLASSTRENAFARVGGTSLFCEALLWALGGAAATGPSATCQEWHISSTRLIELLPAKVNAAAAAHDEQQRVDVAGRPLKMVVQRFEAPPDVDLVVNLQPTDINPQPTAELRFRGSQQVRLAPDWPLRYTGQAGLYQLNVQVEPPRTTPEPTKLINVAPPSCVEQVEVN